MGKGLDEQNCWLHQSRYHPSPSSLIYWIDNLATVYDEVTVRKVHVMAPKLPAQSQIAFTASALRTRGANRASHTIYQADINSRSAIKSKLILSIISSVLFSLGCHRQSSAVPDKFSLVICWLTVCILCVLCQMVHCEEIESSIILCFVFRCGRKLAVSENN